MVIENDWPFFCEHECIKNLDLKKNLVIIVDFFILWNIFYLKIIWNQFLKSDPWINFIEKTKKKYEQKPFKNI